MSGSKRKDVLSPPENQRPSKMATTDTKSPISIEPGNWTQLVDSINGVHVKLDSIIKDKSTTDETIDKVVTDVDNLKQENTELKRLLKKAFSEIEQLRSQVDKLENYSRKNNLVISGLKEESTEDPVQVAKKLMKDKLGIEEPSNLDISVVHRFGSKSSGNPRPLLIRFGDRKSRDAVWAKRLKLKDSGVFVNPDVCRNTDERNKITRAIWRRGKELEEYDVKIVGGNIKVNGKVYQNLDLLPEPLKPKNVFTPTEGDVTLFFTKNSPLSNFYPCQIELDGVTYSCVEQYLWSHKAFVAGDRSAFDAIMDSSNPAEQKAIGRNITLDKEKWDETMYDAMNRAVRAKFHQNSELAEFLCNVESTVIAEANGNDKVWGCGFSMFNPKAFKQAEWTGKNKLGKILVDVRELLKV